MKKKIRIILQGIIYPVSIIKAERDESYICALDERIAYTW